MPCLCVDNCVRNRSLSYQLYRSSILGRPFANSAKARRAFEMPHSAAASCGQSVGICSACRRRMRRPFSSCVPPAQYMRPSQAPSRIPCYCRKQRTQVTCCREGCGRTGYVGCISERKRVRERHQAPVRRAVGRQPGTRAIAGAGAGTPAHRACPRAKRPKTCGLGIHTPARKARSTPKRVRGRRSEWGMCGRQRMGAAASRARAARPPGPYTSADTKARQLGAGKTALALCSQRMPWGGAFQDPVE